MADEQKNGKAGECPCFWCSWRAWRRERHEHTGHWHPGFFILRIIIAIIIVVFVFAIGIKLGELKATMYYAGYDGYGGGYGMMGGYGYSPYYPMHSMIWGNGYGNYGYGPYASPMMQYYYGTPTSTGR